MEAQFVITDPEAVTLAQLGRFDPLAVDEGAGLHGQIPHRIAITLTLDYGVARLYGGVAKQTYAILLRAADANRRPFDPVLTPLEPPGLDRDPCRLGQLLHQPDKEADRQADRRKADQSRK